MKTRTLLTLSVLVLLVVTFAYAQAPTVLAKISFAFMVGKQTLPAGRYEFMREVKPGLVRVSNADKSASPLAPVITRLAAGMHTTPKDAHVVFDRVGDVYALSEIWNPGEDGYLLHAKGNTSIRLWMCRNSPDA